LQWPDLKTRPIFVNVNPDIRWKQRFENYDKALRLLHEALADVDALSNLEKEGAVQRFEFTVELAWKTLKDYLEHSGVVLEQNTPKTVVKQAFAAKIISDGQLWIDMLDCRNRMSHIYDEEKFDEAVREMADRFLIGFDELHEFFKKRITS
jgi:nucleotidyltransferase substrate binding protein (TIGR01987 family)